MLVEGRIHFRTKFGPLLCDTSAPLEHFESEDLPEGKPACGGCVILLQQLGGWVFPAQVALPIEKPSEALRALRRTAWPSVVRLEAIDGEDRWGPLVEESAEEV